jgi:hypothetical protein
MQGLNDCYVFSNVNDVPNNHRLLVLSLQLHLKVLKHDTPTRRGLWDGALLGELGCRATFGWEVGNRFTILPSRAFDLEEEWRCFVMAVSMGATKMVGTQGPMRQNPLGLSPSTVEFVVAKRAAHLAWLSCSHSIATHVVFCLANRKVKAVVSHDA